MGILTVGVISKPFDFEGVKRLKVAERGAAELESYVDSLIVVLNEKLFLGDFNCAFGVFGHITQRHFHAINHSTGRLLLVVGWN